MPQMSPMGWLYLMLYFFMLYTIMMILIYNLLKFNMKFMNNFKKKIMYMYKFLW